MTAQLWVALTLGLLGGGALGTLAAAWFKAKTDAATDRGANWQAYTDDLTGRLSAQDEKIAVQDAKIGELWQARETDARRYADAMQHIGNLELHIIAGKEPPPPPRPAGLI